MHSGSWWRKRCRRREWPMFNPKREETVYVKPDQHWCAYEGSSGENPEKWGQAHMGLSEHYDAILGCLWNWCREELYTGRHREALPCYYLSCILVLSFLDRIAFPELRDVFSTWKHCVLYLSHGNICLLQTGHKALLICAGKRLLKKHL